MDFIGECCHFSKQKFCLEINFLNLNILNILEKYWTNRFFIIVSPFDGIMYYESSFQYLNIFSYLTNIFMKKLNFYKSYFSLIEEPLTLVSLAYTKQIKLNIRHPIYMLLLIRKNVNVAEVLVCWSFPDIIITIIYSYFKDMLRCSFRVPRSILFDKGTKRRLNQGEEENDNSCKKMKE